MALIFNFCFIALFITAAVSMADTGDYIGEHCFSFSDTSHGSTGTLRLGCSKSSS
jgi:hypothetical protein